MASYAEEGSGSDESAEVLIVAPDDEVIKEAYQVRASNSPFEVDVADYFENPNPDNYEVVVADFDGSTTFPREEPEIASEVDLVYTTIDPKNYQDLQKFGFDPKDIVRKPVKDLGDIKRILSEN